MIDSRIRGGIVSTAQALGIRPLDLATAISYETAGTFNPLKAGPRTQWGQHRGLIQWGEPQARKYGVDWRHPVSSQLGPDGAIARYLRHAGVKPGMGMADIYSAINAGRVGRYRASDARNGGAPGTVLDKVRYQMGGHRRKAMGLLGMSADAGSFSMGRAPARLSYQPAPASRQPSASVWDRFPKRRAFAWPRYSPMPAAGGDSDGVMRGLVAVSPEWARMRGYEVD